MMKAFVAYLPSFGASHHLLPKEEGHQGGRRCVTFTLTRGRPSRLTCSAAGCSPRLALATSTCQVFWGGRLVLLDQSLNIGLTASSTAIMMSSFVMLDGYRQGE